MVIQLSVAELIQMQEPNVTNMKERKNIGLRLQKKGSDCFEACFLSVMDLSES